MKKKIVIACALAATTALGFTHKDEIQAKGLRFVAPTIKSRFQVANPEEGEIVFEKTDTTRKFWGYVDANNDTWVELSAGQSTMPVGVILPFGGTTVPDGYLLADGRPLSRNSYPALFAAISTSFGDGTKNADGTSSGYAPGDAFNLPDIRGRFMRGVDGTAGRDPGAADRATLTNGNTGNNVGSIQNDEFLKHKHDTGMITAANDAYYGKSFSHFGIFGNSSGTNFGVLSGDTGGLETRPKNINVNYIIKSE